MIQSIEDLDPRQTTTCIYITKKYFLNMNWLILKTNQSGGHGCGSWSTLLRALGEWIKIHCRFSL